MRACPFIVAIGVLVAACGSGGADDTAVPIPTDVPRAEAPIADDSDTVFSETTDDPTRITLPDAVSTTPPTTTLPPATVVPTTTTTTTTTTRTPTTTTAPPTTTTTATVPTSGAAAETFDLEATDVLVGVSVEGRSIVAERYGTAGGRRVLVIGVIHGNEDAGVAVIDELRDRSIAAEIPDGIELWLVESMNPDGQAVQDRHNANQVDLNRNFPHEWGPIGQPGDGQYAGTGPASEPETQAMVAFISQLMPDIALWYHQDANLIIPSTGRQGRIRARYAELTGLPLADCCGGGIYTGIAATWARVTLSDQEAVPFIVELPGGDLTSEQVTAHTDAVITIAAEG